MAELSQLVAGFFPAVDAEVQLNHGPLSFPLFHCCHPGLSLFAASVSFVIHGLFLCIPFLSVALFGCFWFDLGGGINANCCMTLLVHLLHLVSSDPIFDVLRELHPEGPLVLPGQVLHIPGNVDPQYVLSQDGWVECSGVLVIAREPFCTV